LYQAVALYLGHVRAYPVNQPGLPGLVVLEPLAGRAPVLEAEVVERLDAGLAGPTLDANTSTRWSDAAIVTSLLFQKLW
jgi:hypothetical protein